MKPRWMILFLLVWASSGCDKSSTEAEGAGLHLHWFTIGTEQEFVALQSSEIHLGKHFNSGGLEGKVLKDSRGYHATLRGHHGLSVGDFRNYVETDRVFGPSLYSCSGVTHITYFVVSSDPDPERFYHEMMEARPDGNVSYEIDLDRPLLVDPEPEV